MHAHDSSIYNIDVDVYSSADGRFHICLAFLAVVGKRFGDEGLFDIFVKSDVPQSVNEGRAENITIALSA